MNNNCIYLDTYVLQQDMRIRLPKAILANMNAERGVTKFSIYYDNENSELILKISDDTETSRK